MTNQYLCFDIGGTNLKAGLLDANGGQIQPATSIPMAQDLAAFWQQLFAIADQYVGQIAGIAVSVPGQVDPQTGIVYHGGALPFLDQCPLQQTLAMRYQLPVAVENDGEALAENWRGSLQGCQNGLVLVLGTGVGGGLIIHNQLYRGSHFQAGELSMMLAASTSAPIKITGQTGSAVGMISAIAHELQLPDEHDGRQVFAALAAGNPKALEMFNAYGRQVAQIILNVQAVMDLNVVAIGGGISAQPSVVPMIQRQYAELLEQLPMIRDTLSQPQIVAAKFHNQANLIGALAALLGMATV
ncbi:ROK family protein [Lactiplantibacillus pentosus]|uniref:Sugar kinase and transcription regulator n=1 Tax=Lactiplantibacillus pentosus IG1 TaxID=1042160 RepID=G0M1G1_LACPE|nr:ROK family protein [Lactiplantibacillus pentosus]CCC15980.1 sugar kinase and transcription regulator [Lactiplantibacillus pentosus IG1]MCT3303828.1 ROK family protein [Lactiplantibacillus pentosus]PRO75721.1 ROK family protein [Lactiplantibacillus pentosus]PRO79022.1 ROK family protein [Lactiplantibacillus pentosus]PRO87439.1 ROK family protein [Lactiplantibacillus pentosus]